MLLNHPEGDSLGINEKLLRVNSPEISYCWFQCARFFCNQTGKDDGLSLVFLSDLVLVIFFRIPNNGFSSN